MIRFDSLPPEVVQAMCTPMHQLLPPGPSSASPTGASGALFVGSLAAAADRALLREHHITLVVQILDAPWAPTPDALTLHRIALPDTPAADLRPHLAPAVAAIDAALRAGGSVLVHCQQGVSRSPAIAIAYLIRARGMSFDAAHALVLRARPCIKPNAGFVRILREWEAQQPQQPRPPLARRSTA